MQIELLDEPTNTGFVKNPQKKQKYVSLGELERDTNAQNRQETTETGQEREIGAAVVEETASPSSVGALSERWSTTPAYGNVGVKNIIPTISSSIATADWIHAVPSLKDKELDRLRILGLSDQDMGFFVTQFVGHRWQFIQRSPDGEWYSVGNRRHLNDWDLVRHLAGDIIVGTGCRWDRERRDFRTTYVVVDLDFQDDAADLRNRYDRVVAALGTPSYVIRSSGSGGIHVYYMFARSEPLHALRTSDGQRGDMVKLLEAEGLRQQNGQVEIFPRGHYRDGRGQQARVRAPFGPGSCLLHHVTLEPLAPPGPSSLVVARQLFEDGHVSLVDPAHWFRKRQALPTLSGPLSAKPTSKDASRKKGGRRDRTLATPLFRPRHNPEMIERLLTRGLTSRKQFNEAVVAIAYHFRNDLCLSRDEAHNRLLEWLEIHHNGKSGTYNQNPQKARDEVVDVLSRVYKHERSTTNRRPRRNDSPLPPLTAYEATTLLHVFDNAPACRDPLTGKPVNWYKLVQFAFALLRLAKQYVVTFILRCIRNSPDGTISDSDLATVWPDQSRPEFIVPCPATLRDGRGRKGKGFLKGIGRDTRWKLWRVIQQCGLYRLHRSGCSLAWSRRPATYVVRLDFGAFSETPRSFLTADNAILALIPAESQKARLSKYRCEKLETMSAGVAGIDHHGNEVFDLISRKLTDSSTAGRGAHAA
jgi:hypothetical protein